VRWCVLRYLYVTAFLFFSCVPGCVQCPSNFGFTIIMPKLPGKPNTPPVVVQRPMGLNTFSGSKYNNSGSPGPPTTAPAPSVSEGFRCGCGRSYALKESLARHNRESAARETPLGVNGAMRRSPHLQACGSMSAEHIRRSSSRSSKPKYRLPIASSWERSLK
jgi:hypothetical protein